MLAALVVVAMPVSLASAGNPVVPTTLTPSSVTQTSASLQGTIHWPPVLSRVPLGEPCTAQWYFEYGTTATFGSATPAVSTACFADANVATIVTGLTAGTRYNHRLVVVYGDPYPGNTVAFTTLGVDTDGDGVPDSTDNCDTVPNPSQTDTDGDAIGDVCEAAPPSPDTDGDGVLNAEDNCPDVANPGQEDVNQNDVGDACEPPEPPEPLESVNVSEVSGNVLVKLPGTNTFVPLGPEVQIPVGSTIDARNGAVRLFAPSTSAGRLMPGIGPARVAGALTSAVFSAGLFKVSQQEQPNKLITRVDLTGGDFSQCTPGRSGPGTKVRRIRADGEGAFGTKGKYGTATASSATATTTWSTVDQCRGTLIRAGEGRLVVRDLVRGIKVRLKAGERYLIRKPR